MLPFSQTSSDRTDYWQRIKLLESFKVIQRPNLDKSAPLQILAPAVLGEISFALFVLWVLTAVHSGRVRASIIPGSTRDVSLLVLWRADTAGEASHLHPSFIKDAIEFDRNFWQCPLDGRDEALPANVRRLCPVLNRTRFNLGVSEAVHSMDEPPKSDYCCASRKQELLNYLGRTVEVDPDKYAAMVGGRTVIPLRLDQELASKYFAGTKTNGSDLGKMLDEILLWNAMSVSGIGLGCAHVSVTAPVEFFELDFALYDSAGAARRKITDAEPEGGWEAWCVGHSMCIFETTVGHLAPEERGGRPGMDHAKNKLLNYLAFNSLKFKKVRLHYLSVLKLPQSSDPTTRVFQQTSGFEYWSLSEIYHDVVDLLRSHFDTPVANRIFREWHDSYVAQVNKAAHAFVSAP